MAASISAARMTAMSARQARTDHAYDLVTRLHDWLIADAESVRDAAAR